MNQKIEDLIQKYLKESKSLMANLRTAYGLEEGANLLQKVQDKEIPRKGTFDAFDFEFHGIGICFTKRDDEDFIVDIDFDKKGQMAGFSSSILYFFSMQFNYTARDPIIHRDDIELYLTMQFESGRLIMSSLTFYKFAEKKWMKSLG